MQIDAPDTYAAQMLNHERLHLTLASNSSEPLKGYLVDVYAQLMDHEGRVIEKRLLGSDSLYIPLLPGEKRDIVVQGPTKSMWLESDTIEVSARLSTQDGSEVPAQAAIRIVTADLRDR